MNSSESPILFSLFGLDNDFNHSVLMSQPCNICGKLLCTLINITYHILVLSLTNEADDNSYLQMIEIRVTEIIICLWFYR